MTSADIKWIANHPNDILKHQGEYIGIVDGEIVASARTSGEVMKMVQQIRPDSVPVIMLVPPNGPSL
jgi:hypothetical protein